jgi:uncharacterized protein (UPF0371 family)
MSDDVETIGFDANVYEREQLNAIEGRLSMFGKRSRLYMEIGGHFFVDGHASRVLPGFDSLAKVNILNKLLARASSSNIQLAIVLCVNAKDIDANRMWGELTYGQRLDDELARFERAALPKPRIVFNLMNKSDNASGNDSSSSTSTSTSSSMLLMQTLIERGYECARRFSIDGYPDNVELIMSERGYGADDHLTFERREELDAERLLVVVMALGSSSGKLSTALGQIYLDRERLGVDSGYAKFELFPIWTLAPCHPINLAYEAATADVGDVVLRDPFHRDAYGVDATNYDRDIDAFPLLRALIEAATSDANPMRAATLSPTDMGINMSYKAIVNERACIDASVQEIKRRKQSYANVKHQQAIDKCQELLDALSNQSK